jgi:iron complex transport system permease protein
MSKAEEIQLEKTNFGSTYRKMVAKRILFIAVCIVACVVLAIVSAIIGTYPMTPGQVWEQMAIAILGGDQTTTIYHVVMDLRMPRILGAMVCGFGLAICGTAMQSMLKNPLADPYTMGISSGAGFGAALAILLGIELISGGGVVVNAFIFAVIPAGVIMFLSRFRQATPTMMILCGTALMYLFNAITQLFMLVADPESMSAVYTWMVGSVDGVSYSDILIMLIITAAGSIYIQAMSGQLNVMGLGDDSAKTLGVNVERRRLIVMLVVTLVAASVVSFTGIIGFVGLVAPHIVRTILGSDNRFLLPAAALFGAVLLMASDIVARTIVAPSMLPVGVVTACLGGPLFMFLILRSSREAWA